MTRDEAASVLRAFFRSLDIDSPGLDAAGEGGADIGPVRVLFRHDEDAGTLDCAATVYQFEEAPRPEVLAAVPRVAPTRGGAVLEYRPAWGALCLRRRYEIRPAARQLATDLQQLVAEAVVWGAEGLAQLAAQARQARG